MRLEIVQDDITTLALDAIVNAANERLLGGGGVDGAIHSAAGPGLLGECRGIREVRPGVRCPAGEARITGGHDLPARHVIHTVGPVWDALSAQHCERLLGSCYLACLELATEHGLASVAFPCISTGAYGFPNARAAEIAIETVRGAPGTPERIVFCCFDDEDAALYRDLLG